MSNQIEFNFTPGLLDQYPNFMDCVRASVYGCGKPLKVVAADVDMSLSEFSRKLADNPNDNVNFPLQTLPALVAATGDNSPVLWLCEKFMETDEARNKRAQDQFNNLMAQLAKLAPMVVQK